MLIVENKIFYPSNVQSVIKFNRNNGVPIELTFISTNKYAYEYLCCNCICLSAVAPSCTICTNQFICVDRHWNLFSSCTEKNLFFLLKTRHLTRKFGGQCKNIWPRRPRMYNCLMYVHFELLQIAYDQQNNALQLHFNWNVLRSHSVEHVIEDKKP